MEWNREACLKLIDIYEQNPVLWNPKHGLYYNKIKKHDAWVNIGQNMQCGSEEVKKKMESMLASFRREKSKGKKSVGTGKGRQEVYISKWFAFTRMAFLLDRDEPTETLTSLNDDTETMEAASQEDIEDSLDQSTDINDDHSQNDRGNLDESQTELHQVKRTCRVNLKKGTKQNISREDSTIAEAFGMLKSVVAKEKPAEISDSCTDYGKHVANKLRNYSERTKAIVQYHFNNILFQADMGNFEINRNAAAMNVAANYQNSSITLPTGHFTTPIPTPSPQETSQSEVSYTDLSTPISEVNAQEETGSLGTASNFLSNWQIEHY
ncbi:uncharacterized protein LOC126737557 [Anthonomus grandis grandis]|uniref:uncharacterized protein LOC126737557 n=1 Tax=Anthonomus grandis grandis TaxID=2921223 RepID=UPI002166A372|nr:uncharacterized protein LOC126737557 [Anthonomus grandis grandis]